MNLIMRAVSTIAEWLLIGMAFVGLMLIEFVEWMDEKTGLARPDEEDRES